jgi:hypothetical protein
MDSENKSVGITQRMMFKEMKVEGLVTHCLKWAALCIAWITILVFLSGCVSRDHSYIGKTTVLGMELSYDETFKLPLFRFGYISTEGAAVKDGKALVTRQYQDVNLLKTGGDVNTVMYLESYVDSGVACDSGK